MPYWMMILSGMLLHLELFNCCVHIPERFIVIVSLAGNLDLNVRTYISKPRCI